MMDEVRIKVPQPRLPEEIKFRAPLPILIPLAALTAIALVAFLFSRVLLSVPPEAALVIAAVMAANILGAFAFAALRPELARVHRIELVMVVLYPLLIGVVIAQVGFGESSAEAPEAESAATAEAASGSGAGDFELSAADLAFDTDEIELAAGSPQKVAFDNQDSAEHNLAIYEDDKAGQAQKGALFDGEDIAAGDSTVYEVDPLEAGEYYFQCDIHPTMNGALVASGGSGKGGDSGSKKGDEGGKGGGTDGDGEGA